jgi:Zn-finger protein
MSSFAKTFWQNSTVFCDKKAAESQTVAPCCFEGMKFLRIYCAALLYFCTSENLGEGQRKEPGLLSREFPASRCVLKVFGDP